MLGNARSQSALQELTVALDDEEPMIRGAAAWALGQLQTQPARTALQVRLEVEVDESVREEIQSALAQADSGGSALHD